MAIPFPASREIAQNSARGDLEGKDVGFMRGSFDSRVDLWIQFLQDPNSVWSESKTATKGGGYVCCGSGMQVGSLLNVFEVGVRALGVRFGEVRWRWVGFVNVDVEIGDVGGEVLFKEEVGGAATNSGADYCYGLHGAVLSSHRLWIWGELRTKL